MILGVSLGFGIQTEREIVLQEEWAKISEIMASFGSKLVRESVFVSELEQEFTSRLGLSCSESSLSPSMASSLGLWLSGIGMHDYETLFLDSGYDDIDFIVSIYLQIPIYVSNAKKVLNSLVLNIFHKIIVCIDS